jgi:hypothetical protein
MPAPKKYSVMVITSDAERAQRINARLQKNEAIEVELYPNGEEAIKAIAGLISSGQMLEHNIKAVVMDYRSVPGKQDGLPFVEQLKTLSMMRGVAIYMVNNTPSKQKKPPGVREILEANDIQGLNTALDKIAGKRKAKGEA